MHFWNVVYKKMNIYLLNTESIFIYNIHTYLLSRSDVKQLKLIL